MGRHSTDDDGATPDALDVDDAPERDAEADEFWEAVGVDPVEIALSKGVGYTLRAYVPVEAPEEEEPEDEDEDTEDADGDESDESDDADEKDAKGKDKGKADAKSKDDDADEDADLEDEEEDDEDEEEPVVAAPTTEITEVAVDEAPRFLTADGKLLLFESPAELAEFVRTNRDHDLADLDNWDEVAEKIRDEWVVPTDEDSYELDLVVENLRGGHDVWDHELIIKAGELARDLAFALRLKSVLTALAPGSPIDDLDDALRAVDAGGVGGFFAKRRLKKIGAQQASLAWRSIIGKLSAASDWRK